MTDKAKNIAKYTISGILAIFFIWLVAGKVDWAGFWSGLQQTRWAYIALFILASVAALVFRTLRWRDMLRGVDPEVSTLDTWDAVNVGSFANVGLPGVGELLRCGLVSPNRSKYSGFLGTMVMERMWDVLAIGVIIVLALSMKWNEFGSFIHDNILAAAGGRLNSELWQLAAIAVALLAVAGWAVWKYRDRYAFCGKIAGAVGGMLKGAAATLKMKNKAAFAAYTVLIWLSYVMMSYFGLKAIPELSSLAFSDALFISAVGNLASVIPVPSGMGPYHYLVMTALSGLYACSNETGLLYAVLCHESHAILIITLGIASYMRLSLRKKK